MFWDVIVLVLHIYCCFSTGKTNILKFLMRMSTERLQDPVGGRPRDQMMGRCGDVHGTSVIHIFKIQLRIILNLLWQVAQDFLVNCRGKKFSEQYSDKKIIYTGTRHDEFWKILLKFDLRVCGKVPFLIFWH